MKAFVQKKTVVNGFWTLAVVLIVFTFIFTLVYIARYFGIDIRFF